MYDTGSPGQPIARIAADNVTAPVKACALSADYRHLVAAVGKAYVFRFERPTEPSPA